MNPAMPLGNHNFYPPGLFNMSGIPLYGRQIKPNQQVPLVEGSSLLSESSVCIENDTGTLKECHNFPQVVEKTPQLGGKSEYESSVISGEKSTGNIWDMLVSLLGTEQNNYCVDSTRSNYTSNLDKKHYFGKADICMTSQTSHSQEQLGVSSYKPATSTDVKCPNFVKSASLREEEAKDSPLYVSDYLLKSPFGAPNENVLATRSSRNNETILQKINDVLVSVETHEDQLCEASMPITKVRQGKSNPESAACISIKKELALPKQRKKQRKTKQIEKARTKAKDQLPVATPETREEMTKQTPKGYLKFHPGFYQHAVSKQYIQDEVLQLPRTVESTALNKITSITMQCWDEQKEVLVWTDSLMKFLDPLSIYERLHSLQMKNQDISGSLVTGIHKLDAQPILSLESGLGYDTNIRSVSEQWGSFKQNPLVTSLHTSTQSKNTFSISEGSPMINSRAINNAVELIKPAEISIPVAVHDGDTAVCKSRKSRSLQADFAGCMHHDQFMERQEGCNVDRPVQVCLQAEGENQFAAMVEETFSPENQLKLLLHSGHCQLPECALASCTETKRLLKHCARCMEDNQCPVNHCSVSRTLLNHWNFCRVFHCPLCVSIRHPDNMESSIRTTKRDHNYNYPTNSREAKLYGASLVSNSTTNMVNTTATATTPKRGPAITTMVNLASTYSEDKREANTSKRTRLNLQENQRCFAPNVYGSFSQAEWDCPLGSNDLGEDLHQIFWTMGLELDDQQLSTNDTGSRYSEEGPTLAAGFTVSAQHLRQRLDCLLHGITCENSSQETSKECVRKHCSIMKASMLHMSSCSEFTSCSNVICLLFSPLLLHWKSCCGPCSICGSINLKYNKKKLLSKISSKFVAHETQENVAFQEHREIDGWRRQRINRAAPYYLRKYMMEDQPSVPVESNGYKLQVVPGKKFEGVSFVSAGMTWDRLPGIDCVLNSLLEKPKPSTVNNPGSIKSYEPKTLCPVYSDNDKDQDCIQDLLYAIGLYNYQARGPNNIGKMLPNVMP